MSVKEVAEVFEVDPSTVNRWIRTGWIHAEIRPGRRRDKYRIPRTEVDRLRAGG